MISKYTQIYFTCLKQYNFIHNYKWVDTIQPLISELLSKTESNLLSNRQMNLDNLAIYPQIGQQYGINNKAAIALYNVNQMSN